MTYECELCGREIPDDTEHDHTNALVIMRDAWRGQYLTACFISDVDALVPGKVDEMMLDIASRWDAQMGMPSNAPDISDDEYESAMDYSMYQCETILSDAGYYVHWEDGYAIYQTDLLTGGETT